MPCYTPEPSVSESVWLNDMYINALKFLTDEQKNILVSDVKAENLGNMDFALCKICKYLSNNQLELVKGIDCYQGLREWYKEHLLRDFCKNYNNEDHTEKDICISESERLGFIMGINEEGRPFLKEGGYTIINY